MDISNWKEFFIGDLFTISRGKRILKSDYIENGKYNVVTAKTSNNGIDGKFSEFNAPKNILTVCGEVSGFKTFYQENETWVLDTSRILIPKFKIFNKYIALFFIPILEKNMIKYSYGRKLKPEGLEKTIIKLPINDSNKPDWEYMENYIKEKFLRSYDKDFSSSFYKQKLNLSISNWKEFRIGEFFDVTRGKRITKQDYKKNGKYSVITATTINNGVDGYYNRKNAQKNILTVGGEASGFKTFYQEDETWVMDRARICHPLFKEFNKFNALFLIPIFEKNMNKYTYGRSANPEDIKRTIIKLPVDKKGNPDWKYMEKYIKSLNYSKYI